jgi:hypothetical protein
MPDSSLGHDISCPDYFHGSPQCPSPTKTLIFSWLEYSRLLPNLLNSSLICHPTIRRYVLQRLCQEIPPPQGKNHKMLKCSKESVRQTNGPVSRMQWRQFCCVAQAEQSGHCEASTTLRYLLLKQRSHEHHSIPSPRSYNSSCNWETMFLFLQIKTL